MFSCKNRACGKTYDTNKSLLRHYKWYPAYTSGPLPVRTRTAPVINARDATRDFVAVSQPHRGARIKELIGGLTRQELLESVVPTVVTTCSLLELIEAKTQDKSISVLDESIKEVDAFLHNFCTTNVTVPMDASTEDKLSELLSKHPMFVCEKILEFDDGKFFREKLMPEVEKRHAKDILKTFSRGCWCFGSKCQRYAGLLNKSVWEAIQVGIGPLSKG